MHADTAAEPIPEDKPGEHRSGTVDAPNKQCSVVDINQGFGAVHSPFGISGSMTNPARPLKTMYVV